MVSTPSGSNRHDDVRAVLAEHIPEVADHRIAIISIARAAGAVKIAVKPQSTAINPFTPFLAHGRRLSEISARLDGDNPTIVEYHDDPLRYVANAFRPIPVISATVLDPDQRRIRIVVGRGKDYARALGKAGANVQLVRDLTGWNISICTDGCVGRLHFHNQAGTPSSPVSNLAALTEAEFLAVVRENTAPSARHAPTWERLVSPALVSRTRDVLVHLLGVLESQRDPQQGYTAQQAQRRTDLQAALTITTPAYKDTLRQQSEDIAFYRRQLRHLATALAAHRDTLDATARTAADTTLWTLLDVLAIPDGDERTPTTLADMLAGPWRQPPAPQQFSA
ncbi:MAG: hypothetical protein E6R06_07505 [Mycobacterium sp.]|nr:MAG: hypothetical protein E6R06_07505 [Mycobacterium sp.]